jgi:hypothetical protein
MSRTLSTAMLVSQASIAAGVAQVELSPMTRSNWRCRWRRTRRDFRSRNNSRAAPAFAGGPPPEDAARRAELFAEADANGDQMLSREEMATLAQLMRARRAERRFTELDQNGDALVSAEEFAAARPPCKHGGPRS